MGYILCVRSFQMRFRTINCKLAIARVGCCDLVSGTDAVTSWLRFSANPVEVAEVAGTLGSAIREPRHFRGRQAAD